MSELTTCNYCTLQHIKRRAKKTGHSVVVTPSPWHTFDKGVDVHVNREFVCWLAELTDHCAC